MNGKTKSQILNKINNKSLYDHIHIWGLKHGWG